MDNKINNNKKKFRFYCNIKGDIYDNNWGNIRVGEELLAATDSPHDGCLELNKNIGHGPGLDCVYRG